ncbi:MAG: hypothetical protein ACI4RD_00760 [Kiritimatiellia bacterium]
MKKLLFAALAAAIAGVRADEVGRDALVTNQTGQLAPVVISGSRIGDMVSPVCVFAAAAMTRSGACRCRLTLHRNAAKSVRSVPTEGGR